MLAVSPAVKPAASRNHGGMIIFRRGDDFAYVGVVREHGSTSAFDLTGWGIEATLERRGGQGSLALLASVQGASDGIFSVDQGHTVTSTWAAGSYNLRIRLVHPDGSRISGGDMPTRVIA